MSAVAAVSFVYGATVLPPDLRPSRENPFGPYLIWLCLGFGLFFALAAIEWPRRCVIVEGEHLRERHWFHWTSRGLPQVVWVGTDFAGRAVIADPGSGRVLFTFPREFGGHNETAATLQAFFSAANRLVAPN